MKLGYLIGTLFFLTGSWMLFLHRLASTMVHYLMNFVNEETIKLNGAFDVAGMLFIGIGIVLIAYSFWTARRPARP